MGKTYIQRVPVMIQGRKWKAYFMTDRQYNRLGRPDDSWACTDGRHRCFYFNCEANFFNYGVVRHELMHGFIFENMGHDVPMSREQFEEFVCALMEEKVLLLMKAAKPLMALLRKHAKRLKAKSSAVGEEGEAVDE